MPSTTALDFTSPLHALGYASFRPGQLEALEPLATFRHAPPTASLTCRVCGCPVARTCVWSELVVVNSRRRLIKTLHLGRGAVAGARVGEVAARDKDRR